MLELRYSSPNDLRRIAYQPLIKQHPTKPPFRFLPTLSMFTPTFKAAIEEINKQIDSDPENAPKIFRDKMLELGQTERIRNLYRIRSKLLGKFVRFTPNPSQEKYITEQSGRDIILKPRQVGFTTYKCIESLDSALWLKSRAGIMAHKQETVKLIFDIIKQAYDYFKKDWGKYYAPEEESNNTTRLSWKDLRSSITVAYDFQGMTVDTLHVSEAHFIESNRLTNSLQAVPETGKVTLESTANGRGGFFYNAWQDWKKFSGSAPFRGHFFPWFEHYPELPERWQPKTGQKWTDEELELKERYNLEDYHLVWRRYKIQESCDGSVETFETQYPSDDETCFLVSQRGVIPRNVLQYQSGFVTIPKHIGILKLNNKKVELFNDKKGSLKIWQLPQPGKVYAGGADPSGGFGHDPGAAVIFEYGSGEQVAELVGMFDPDLFAHELYKLGQFYNRCFWCVEANNHGAAVLLQLRALYPNLYKRQEFDTITRKPSTHYGFMTESSTKKMMITDYLVAALRDGTVKIHSDALMSELSTFVHVMKKGTDGRVQATTRREALAGCYDDRVMAACLALEMMRSKPHIPETKGINRDSAINYDPDTGFLTMETVHGESDYGLW